MAHIHRLIALLLLCVSFSALSAFPPYERVQYVYNQQNLYFDDLNAACAAAFPIVIASIPQAFKPIKGQKVTDLGDQGGRCEVESNGNGWYSAAITRVVSNSCPANSTLSAGLCICAEGTKEQTGSDGNKVCTEDKPKTADEKCEDIAAFYNSWNWADSRQAQLDSAKVHPLDEPFKVCMSNAQLFSGTELDSPDNPPGCMHNFTANMRGRLDENSPVNRYWGDTWMVDTWSQGTKACVPGLDDQPGDPPDIPRADPQGPCKGHEGSVNGVSVCIDPSSGRTEGVDWTRVTDANGNTKEQKTEVTCVGEKCTVKTTTKTPGGTDENTTTTTTTRGQYCAKNPESAICKGDKDNTGSTRNQNGRGGAGDPAGGGGKGDGEGKGFCEENPNSPQCKESSFGGSCQASFTCDGDAIQCSIAREQHIRNCKLFDDPSDESRLYDAEKAKDRNRDVTANLPGNETVDVAGKIKRDDLLGGGGGSCIGDLNVQVMGQSMNLPLSVICPHLGYLGYILVAVASLVAARIVASPSKE